jgi:hypothetical protein
VSLTLVTGPANAAKAAVVLERLRAALDHAPLLVVPTAADADRFRRELAEAGLVFGPKVVRFAGLVDEAARRAGVGGRPLGALARERVAGAVARRARLDALADSAATPGFAAAAAAFFGELEVARVDPGRFAGAVRAWAGDDARRRAYGEEVASLYGGYRAALERIGRRDPDQHALAAFDALRLEPRAWGATPVLFYGFDDLTPLQRDAVETLARVADVTLSLPYEAGRHAFAGRATTFEELRPLADEVVALPARDDFYAAPALHALERGLFEDDAPSDVDPGDAVVLLEAGGERAQVELVAAELKRLLDEGVPDEEIAVVVRSPEQGGPLLERVLAEYGVPFSLRRRVPFGRTAAGRALLGLLRTATGRGTAHDVVAWLRSPAVVGRQGLVDALEAQVRREGLAGADAALDAWAEAGRHLPAGLPRVRDAAREGTAPLCAALGAELGRALAGAGTGPLDAAARAEAAAIAAGRAALEELAALAVAAPDLAPGTTELAATLEAVEVTIGDRPGPGRVTISDPLALRARRVRALVLCGLQEGELPRPPRPEPFFGADERRELATAGGVRLPLVADGELGAERYLFYATVSRPEERLVLAFRTADDDGEPAVPSFFLDDVRALFSGELWQRRIRRPLGAVGWDAPPTSRAAARAAAASCPPRRPACVGPLSQEPALRALRERPAWSASSLEVWAGCPVRWFVERYLDAEDLEPRPEPMIRGSVAHEALERALEEQREETGSARITPETLPAVRERLRAALTLAAERARISTSPERMRAAERRLEADLERYLEGAARDGSTYEPAHFEVGFGFEDEKSLPPLELDDGEGGVLRLRGRVDRVDVDPAGGRAIVIDYKGRSVNQADKWATDQDFQAALYARVVRDLMGLEPAGAFYQPTTGPDLRRRGLIVEDAEPDLRVVSTDRKAPEEAEQILTTVLDLATAAAREARAGRLEPRPETCTPQKTCAYPGLCRCPDA